MGSTASTASEWRWRFGVSTTRSHLGLLGIGVGAGRPHGRSRIHNRICVLFQRGLRPIAGAIAGRLGANPIARPLNEYCVKLRAALGVILGYTALGLLSKECVGQALVWGCRPSTGTASRPSKS